jgi:tripartite-type tricarboxylate transporter receptor subunit TctC
VAAALSSALNSKIGSLLSSPGAITLTAIKELQQALALLEKLKASPGDTRKTEGATITPEQLQAEIRKVYGI